MQTTSTVYNVVNNVTYRKSQGKLQLLHAMVNSTRQASSMIHSARPTVLPVATTNFILNSFVLRYFEGTDVQTPCLKIVITTGVIVDLPGGSRNVSPKYLQLSHAIYDVSLTYITS